MIDQKQHYKDVKWLIKIVLKISKVDCILIMNIHKQKKALIQNGMLNKNYFHNRISTKVLNLESVNNIKNEFHAHIPYCYDVLRKFN